MSINKVFISGNLTRDAELAQTAGGMSVLGFSVAVNDRVKDASGNYTDRPYFFDCKMFGKRAESLASYLAKGTKVTIEGKLRWSQWEAKGGGVRTKVEVIVDELEMSTRANESRSAATSAPDTAYDLYEEDCPF